MTLATINIVSYRPEHQPWFESLNRRWIETHFVMEPQDWQTLQQPDLTIIQPGGHIFMACVGETPVGTVALKPLEATQYELTKMAVDPAYQGHGLGKRLAMAAIDWARAQQAHELVLFSNTSLTTAIALYRKLGFVEVPLEAAYTRADIQMRLRIVNV